MSVIKTVRCPHCSKVLPLETPERKVKGIQTPPDVFPAKYCSRCKMLLPLDAFYQSPGNVYTDGHGYCKRCCRHYGYEYRERVRQWKQARQAG
jgi:hypothetical protein